MNINQQLNYAKIKLPEKAQKLTIVLTFPKPRRRINWSKDAIYYLLFVLNFDQIKGRDIVK
jgi:hypothetical protein